MVQAIAVDGDGVPVYFAVHANPNGLFQLAKLREDKRTIVDEARGEGAYDRLVKQMAEEVAALKEPS